METIIEVDHLSIYYKNKKSVSYRDIIKNLSKRKETSKKGFLALDDVSFKVYKGETLGVIGENGSGKSTLLSALAGIYGPDHGEIKIKCDKYSLLALGVGFQSRLTGYENIFLSGYALGFSKEEICDKLEEIIEFSELEDFIYKPVKTYSSGMYSKLSFSISSSLATDVLFIDEVLGVGDLRFREKSSKRMHHMIQDENRSVVFVSHSIDAIKDSCDRVLWLKEGKIHLMGETHKVLDQYKEYMKR